ncbi:MAG: response regulator [Pseudomonadota bacterium]|nr:response regulator [Pseudomonadota bacterium]
MVKVLIVDDDPDIREAVRLVLEKEGIDVSGADACDSGMKAVREDNPDLLILDVMMNEADDGFAMARELRVEGFDKPIIMLTSVDNVMIDEYGADDDLAPVNRYLEKPIAPDALVAEVKALLYKKGGCCRD